MDYCNFVCSLRLLSFLRGSTVLTILSLMGCFSEVRACTLQDCRFCSGKLEHELSTSFPFLTFEQREHLVRHYGFMARDVVELAKKESLMEPLVEGLPYLKAEVLYACR